MRCGKSASSWARQDVTHGRLTLLVASSEVSLCRARDYHIPLPRRTKHINNRPDFWSANSKTWRFLPLCIRFMRRFSMVQPAPGRTSFHFPDCPTPLSALSYVQFLPHPSLACSLQPATASFIGREIFKQSIREASLHDLVGSCCQVRDSHSRMRKS